jgi:hypothetical protein
MDKQGLYQKYNVTKTDGSPVDPNARYFVLRLDTDAAARQAVLMYIETMIENGLDDGLLSLCSALMQACLDADWELAIHCPMCRGEGVVENHTTEAFEDCPICLNRTTPYSN